MVDKGKLIRCRGCGTPLARMDGNNIHYIKYHGRERIEVTVKVQHTRGGVITIGCDDCPITPHYFVTLVHPTYVAPLRVEVYDSTAVSDSVAVQ